MSRKGLILQHHELSREILDDLILGATLDGGAERDGDLAPSFGKSLR
jgi:hypothetical protein